MGLRAKRKVLSLLGHEVSYLDTEGAGTPIVFVHGNSSSSRIFDSQFESSLFADFRLIALDLPGHGASSRVPESAHPGYSMPFFSGVLEAFLAAVDAQDGLVVGHSLGGHVLIETASRLRKLRGLVIFGAPPLGSLQDFQKGFLPCSAGAVIFKADPSEEEIEDWAKACFFERAKVPSEFKDTFKRTHALVRSSLIETLFAGKFEDEVKAVLELPIPIAVIHGENEALVNLDYLRGVSIPKLWRKSVQVISSSGHYAHVEQSERFNELLLEFASEVKERV